MKVVINSCHGGFGLSRLATEQFAQRRGIELGEWHDEWHGFTEFDSFNINRSDPLLVEIVEQLGEAASDKFSRLKVVEVPDEVKWTIKEYDGLEWVAEIHRTWS